MMVLHCLVLLLPSAIAWVVVAPPRPMTTGTQLALSNVRSVSLESLQDHLDEGILLSKSIVAWLDAEVCA